MDDKNFMATGYLTKPKAEMEDRLGFTIDFIKNKGSRSQ